MISKPEDAIDMVGYELWGPEQEELWIVDTRKNWIRTEELYQGCLSSSSVRIGEVLKAAVHLPARSIFIFHDHPSMDPTESPEDAALTLQYKQAS